MSKRKMLITGGAGFIGGNFVHYMVNNYPNYDIYNLDLLTYAGDLTKHKEIENKQNYHFIQCDISDRCFLAHVPMHGPDPGALQLGPQDGPPARLVVR